MRRSWWVLDLLEDLLRFTSPHEAGWWNLIQVQDSCTLDYLANEHEAMSWGARVVIRCVCG